MQGGPGPSPPSSGLPRDHAAPGRWGREPPSSPSEVRGPGHSSDVGSPQRCTAESTGLGRKHWAWGSRPASLQGQCPALRAPGLLLSPGRAPRAPRRGSWHSGRRGRARAVVHELQHPVSGETSLMRAVPVAQSSPGPSRGGDPDLRRPPATCSQGQAPPPRPRPALPPLPALVCLSQPDPGLAHRQGAGAQPSGMSPAARAGQP